MFLLALSMLASACTDSGSDAQSSTTTSVSDGADDTATDDTTPDEQGSGTGSDRPDDDLAWSQCSRLECTTVEVPMDYGPGAGAETLEIEVARVSADGEPDDYRGALFINPGGPGVSAVEFLDFAHDGYLPADLTDHFDLIAFDPRGVGNSEPEFECGLDGDWVVIAGAIDGLADTAEEVELAELSTQQCVDSMGAVAGLLHTEFVARDMDTVRDALGFEQLSYLGYSYGSAIGVWYASLFPDRVRAMVLDGANDPIDPSDTTAQRVESAMEELVPLEARLRQAIEACDDATCPIWNDGDPIAYFEQATAKLDLVDAYLGGVPFAGALGVITTLYSEQTWPLLWDALEDLVEFDDPSILGELALFQLDDPGQPSFTGYVNCLDSWSIYPDVDRAERLGDTIALSEQVAADLPLLAMMDTIAFDQCPFLDSIAPDPSPVTLDGGGITIVVVGNHDDPVTPFTESEELAFDTLADGRLIEVTHPEHTVYPNNDCVKELVDSTLIDGRPPAEPVTSCG